MATPRPRPGTSVACTRVSKTPRAPVRPKDAEEAEDKSNFAALVIILVRTQT